MATAVAAGPPPPRFFRNIYSSSPSSLAPCPCSSSTMARATFALLALAFMAAAVSARITRVSARS